MSADEFQQLWKEYDSKLQKSLHLNQQLMEELHTRRMHVSFNWQIFFKFFMILLGVAFNILLGTLLWRFRANPVFVVASALLILFTSFSICGYLTQALLMMRINMVKSIMKTQKELAWLETIIVWTLRISFMQAPIYAFLFIPRIAIANGGPLFWTIEIAIAALLLVTVIWLFRKITVPNSRSGWVKKLVDNEGGRSIARARELIKEIEEFRKEA